MRDDVSMQKFPAGREFRYQGAIVHEHKILLIKHKPLGEQPSFWLFPGGGIEEGETETECVQREMKEETNLDVEVIGLILDEPGFPGEPYRRLKTYLCKPIGGTAEPGYEPELEGDDKYVISEVGWFDLMDKSGWGEVVINDPYTYPQLERIREELGYE